MGIFTSFMKFYKLEKKNIRQFPIFHDKLHVLQFGSKIFFPLTYLEFNTGLTASDKLKQNLDGSGSHL